MPKAKEVKTAPEPKEEGKVVENFTEENTRDYGSSFKPARGKGVLELMSEGYGFLRSSGVNPGPNDIYISQSQIRRFDIRAGDEVEGEVRPPKDTERYFGMLKVEKVNGLAPEAAMKRKKIENLVAIYPDKQLKLETGKSPLSTRMI